MISSPVNSVSNRAMGVWVYFAPRLYVWVRFPARVLSEPDPTGAFTAEVLYEPYPRSWIDDCLAVHHVGSCNVIVRVSTVAGDTLSSEVITEMEDHPIDAEAVKIEWLPGGKVRFVSRRGEVVILGTAAVARAMPGRMKMDWHFAGKAGLSDAEQRSNMD